MTRLHSLRPRLPKGCRRPAFSLVELLTVIFIITALIGILVPSLSAARNAAKKVTSRKALKSIETGLQLFKQENDKNFRRTNGFPPSWAYPRTFGDKIDPIEGEFPFIPADEPLTPVVYGAHWLPAMLIGPDAQGYVSRRNVPVNLREEPNEWYKPDPGGNDEALPRQQLYVDPGGVNLIATNELPGRRPNDFFPNWEQMESLPVIADGFDYPILYYVAQRNGSPSNMVEDRRVENNEYTGGDQQEGPPFYFHQDNEGFTGTEDAAGWDFQGTDHNLKKSGADDAADKFFLTDPATNRTIETFARRIVDRAIYRELELKSDAERAKSQLRPVNADSFILVSPGVDGLYGTNDDISNIPDFIDN